MSDCNSILCSFASGYKLPQCVLSQSGIQRIYLAPFSRDWMGTGVTFNADCVITGVTSVTGFTNSSGGTVDGGGEIFYAFDLLPETGSFNTPVPSNVQNASQHYESTIELVIGNNTPQLRNTLKAILAGPTVAIVELRANNDGIPGLSPFDGDLLLVGPTIGCWAQSGSKIDAGKASADFRGWMAQLQAKEPVPPYFIQDKSCFQFSY